MGIGAQVNRAMQQAQPMQQPSAPSSIGGKGSALNQAVQPSMQRPEPLQQPMQDPYAQRLGVYDASQFGQTNPLAMSNQSDQLAMQRQMQQPQPMGGKGLAGGVQAMPQTQLSQPNPLAGQTQSAMGNFAAQQAMQQQAMQNAYAQPLQQMPMQQMQQQPAMNPAIQNILRRSRGLGGKGMR
jgi:hypothetical protein